MKMLFPLPQTANSSPIMAILNQSYAFYKF